MFMSYSITRTSRSPEWAKVKRRMYAVVLHSTYEDGFGKRKASQDMARATGTDFFFVTLDSLAVTVFLRRESQDFFTRSGRQTFCPTLEAKTIKFHKPKEVL